MRRRYRKQKNHSEATQEPFIKPSVQKKLKVGKPGDKYEVEADAMADKVVNKTDGNSNVQKKEGEEEVQQKPLAAGVTPLVQRMAASDEEVQQKVQLQEEEEAVQAKGEEEEESMQLKEEEEEAVQAKGEEEEESMQLKEEEEEAVQAKGEEEEESMQLKEEEEEAVQAKGEEEEESMQLKEEEEEAVQAKGEEEEESMQLKEEEEESVQAKGEEEEEAMQMKANGGNKGTGGDMASRLRKKSGSGRKMDQQTTSEMESGFGASFSDVNIHTDAEAIAMTKQMGAQAFTHGNDVYFNEGKYNPNTREGKHLLAHELTHTLQQRNDVQLKPEIQLREATLLERRAWLSFFDHYIPRMFLNNYMNDTGDPITLTAQQMEDCNPVVTVMRSDAIVAEIQRLAAQGGGTATISATGWGGALTNGSLGNFTIHYNGTIHVQQDGSWSFSGTMRFTDYWDFDPKPFGNSGRSTAGELKTRVGAHMIPGRPFEIDSVTVPVSQTHQQERASWGDNFRPVSVGDHATRTAADIEVTGGAAVGGGPGAVDVGGEFGAQSSEDLN